MIINFDGRRFKLKDGMFEEEKQQSPILTGLYIVTYIGALFVLDKLAFAFVGHSFIKALFVGIWHDIVGIFI